MQMLCEHINNYITPNAGRLAASQRAGAGKKKDRRTQFLKLPDLEET